jgi:protein SCO1/2
VKPALAIRPLAVAALLALCGTGPAVAPAAATTATGAQPAATLGTAVAPAHSAAPATATSSAATGTRAATGAAVATGTPAATTGTPTGLDPDVALRASRAAIGRTVGDYAFLDRENRQVRLASYRGKPLLVNFVYTGCISACPVTTKRIADVIGEAQRTLGPGQFNVVTIGINPPADSPESMRDFARRFGLDSPNWEFLTPYAQQLPRLVEEFGFSYVATSWGFDHVAQVTVVDESGRVYRQVYGEDFAARQLVDPLKELISGTPLPLDTVSDLIERVRILCTVYDPSSGAYRFNYGIIAQLIGLIAATLTIVLYLVHEHRARRRTRPSV